MAQTIKLKRSSVSGNTPGTSDLELGEVAINTYDGKMFIKKNDGSDSIVEIGGTSGTVTEAFKTIAVSGQSNVVADSGTDTLTLVAGSNMTITTNASGDSITFASSGGGGTQNVFTTFAVSGQSNVVADGTTDTLTLVAGTGIGLTTDASADSITIANTTNLFSTIAVSGQSNVVADATSDTLTFVAGSGITLTTDASADSVTITNSATGANAFGNILVSGQSTVAADSTNDNLTLVAGSNMTITTNASNDTITFASSGGGGGSQNLFSNIAVSGQGTVQADATTDTLTFVAGTGISLATDTSADSLTITNTGSVNVANAASSIKEFKYDISSSTTNITGSDANSNTLAYEAGAIQVFLNGILLDPATDYTATNGTSVVLTDAAVNGDDVQIVAFNRKIVTANVGIDTFTGNGSTTAYTLSSDPENENNTRVHIDGVYQEKAAYSVSGTTLTFSAAPPNGSSIEVEIGFTQAQIGSTLDFADNAVLRIGTGNDLQILHDGSNSIIKDTGTGDLQIAASTLEVKNAAINETMIKAIQDGAVELYHDNNKKLETVTGGVTITGTVTATTFSGDLSGTINTATTGTTQSASDNSTKLATTAYVTTALSNLVDSAPGTLNTLNELAAALGDDANFSTTITNSLATKVGLTATTGAATIPAGTTAQRPGSPAAGQFRYNSTLSQFEGYTSSWGAIGGGGTNTFTTDVFTSSGSAAFTLTQAVSSPNDCIVHIDGIYQTPTDAYTVSGTTLTFTATPASGRKVVVYSVKAGVSGNNLNIQTFSGNGSATSFTMNVNPINENNTIVHIDGVYQQKTSYSTSGTTLAFSAAPANGTTIEVATFTQTEINVPVNDTIDTVHIKDDAVTSAKLGGNLVTPGTLDVNGAEFILDADADTSLTADTDDQIDIKIGGTDQIKLIDGAILPVTTNDIDLGSTSLEFKNAYFDGTVTSDAFAGPLTGNVAGNLTGTILTAAQTNITSLGTLTALNVDNIGINGDTITLTGASATGFLQTSSNSVQMGSSTSDQLILYTDNTAALTIDTSQNATFAGTIATGGITINGAGSTISDSSDLGIASGGDLTMDVAGDIILDSDNGVYRLKDGGASLLQIARDGSTSVHFYSAVSDMDMLFKGNDGGSTITALTLDMSNAGAAIFGGSILTPAAGVIETTSSAGTLTISGGATNKGGKIELSGGNNTGAGGAGIKFYAQASTATPAERMRISATGLVGINDQNPDRMVSIIGDSTSGGQYPLSLDATNTDYIMEFRRSGTSEWWFKASASNFTVHQNGVGDEFSIYNGSVKVHGILGVNKAANPAVGLSVGADTTATNSYGLEVCNASANTRFLVDGVGNSYFYKTNNAIGMYYDATNARLGIGTSSPSQDLEVSGTGSTRIKITNTDTNWAGLDIQSGGNQANYIFFRDENLERARIQVTDNNDLIFLTGSSPATRLTIADTGYLSLGTSGRLYFPDGGLALFGGGSDLKISHGGSGYAHHSIIEHTNTNGALKLKTADFRLEDPSGNNRYKIPSGNRHFFYGMNSTSSVGSWAFGHTSEAASGGYMSSWTTVFGQRIHLRNNNGSSTSSHGTTTFSGSSANNFRIMQNIGYNGVYWNSSTDTGVGTNTEMASGNWYWTNSNSVASGSQYTMTNRMQLNNNGNLYITGSLTQNTTVSDARLKQDIEEFPSALEKMKALRTVKFNWIDEERRGEHKEIGLIAQEVKEIYPELIGTTDAIDAKEDPETLEKIPGEERYMMHYEKLTVVLLKAMQEQQELIETLQTKVAALEAK